MNNNVIQESSMLSVGTTLRNGAYRIVKYLSSGGFGNTYVAVNQFDETVAIKEFYMRGINKRLQNNMVTIAVMDSYDQFAEQLEKFQKEAKRLRKLKNPHIVGVHDLFSENGTSYYVMDFINGISIGDRLKNTNRPIPEVEALLYFDHILDALKEVHGKGFFHLDIKPANILVENDIARLIDFGASKQMLARGGATRTAMCYTPGYAPSEQVDQQLDNFGPWTDLYALGATLYSMLTANKPPKSGDIIDHGENAFLFPPSVSESARQLVVALMRPSRKRRPQNVDAVYAMIKELGIGKFDPKIGKVEIDAENDAVSPKPAAVNAEPKKTDDNKKVAVEGKTDGDKQNTGGQIKEDKKPADNKIKKLKVGDIKQKIEKDNAARNRGTIAEDVEVEAIDDDILDVNIVEDDVNVVDGEIIEAEADVAESITPEPAITPENQPMGALGFGGKKTQKTNPQSGENRKSPTQSANQRPFQPYAPTPSSPQSGQGSPYFSTPSSPQPGVRQPYDPTPSSPQSGQGTPYFSTPSSPQPGVRQPYSPTPSSPQSGQGTPYFSTPSSPQRPMPYMQQTSQPSRAAQPVYSNDPSLSKSRNTYPSNQYSGQIVDENKNANKNNMLIIGIIVAVVLVALAVIFIAVTGDDNSSGTSTELTDDAIRVNGVEQTIEYTDELGELKAVTFTYYGPILRNLPNGQGKGEYSDGTYEGPYENGIRQGDNATFKRKDGYTYTGTYINDKPYEGEWTDPYGNLFSKIHEGY